MMADGRRRLAAGTLDAKSPQRYFECSDPPGLRGSESSTAMRTGILRRFLLSAGVGLCLIGPALAEPAITTGPAAMRRAPSAHSRIVQTIPGNAQIDVESCSGGWCYASWRNLFGYVPAFAVAQGGPPPMAAPPPPVVVAAPPIVVAPAFGWGGPYVGGGWGYGWRHW
jgi:hypothetical protein